MAAKKGGEEWNGRDFYVNFGESSGRSWEDAQRYGFIAAGGGKWYVQTLALLFLGARVFVNLPKAGFVGVGIVKEEAIPVTEFKVECNGKTIPILNADMKADMGQNSDDPEKCEQLVRVEWIKAVGREEAFWEKGMFAIQLSVCRLRNRFTLERLTKHFGLED